ncbi:MAG TPA: tetratricopeptide repeat protein [Candidatus Acidoferrales bacterium]|nr:tetratricopeptide repeat protein [Candidatus Acidoferrales bacterium]
MPSEILERPVPLRQGIGSAEEKVTTSSPQAQAFYNQGVAYLNSFVWIEAARSFHQALRLDPGLAMAYLGLSDAYIGLQDVAAARSAFAKAQALGAKASERERERIAIRAKELAFLEDSGNLQKYFAWRQEIGNALKTDPRNPWQWIQRGFADEGSPFAHGQNGGTDTIAFYQTALDLAPGNFAPHHYLAHTYETLGLAREALEESEIYERMCPAIPHAHHMRGHELRRLGRTEEAVAEFLKADELENDYYRAENISARYDWHHAHNLNLLAMSYETLGQMKDAEARFREAFSLPAYADLAEYDRGSWPEFLLDRGRPAEALGAAEELAKSRWAMGRLAGHALAGRAMLALGRVEDAKNELSLAEQELEQLPAALAGTLPNAAELRGEILLEEKNWKEADALMEQIEQKIDAVPGPDGWSEALFQLDSIGRVARAAGDWPLAESTAQIIVRHDPSYAGGYYALGLVAEHAGGAAAARHDFAEAQVRWARADDGLPELAHIRQRLAADK